MTDRPSVLQVAELGVESSYGGTVDPSRLLRSLDTFTMTPQAEHATLSTQGFKVPTLTALNREWATGTYDMGMGDYNEIVYVLNSVLDDVTAGTIAAGTSYSWTYTPDSDGLDTYASYTFRRGDANHAELVPGVVFQTFDLSVSRESVSVTGNWIGQAITAGTVITGTASFLSLSQQPILPGHWSVYIDDTSGNLGNTKLTRDFTFDLSISKLQEVWVVDAAQASFVTLTEGPMEISATLQIGSDYDSGGSGLIDDLRNGTTKFIRAEATGADIGDGTNYTFRIDLAAQVINHLTPQENSGLDVFEWTFQPVHDSSWGQAMQVLVNNGINSL